MKQHWELVADLYQANPAERQRIREYAASQYDEVMRQFTELSRELDTYVDIFSDAKWPTPQESEEL